MDQAEKTMIENLRKMTGKSIDDWKEIARSSGLEKHGQILNWLKTEHGLGHGYSGYIAHKLLGTDAGSAVDGQELIDRQYVGKENLRPFYEMLMAKILEMGSDIEVAPKNSSVSLRCKKQFCLLEPKTRTRFEIGLNLKGITPDGKLETCPPGGMCSHKFRIEQAEEIDSEVFRWIKVAHDQAG